MLLDEEGLAAVFHRHDRHAEATRRAVTGWGLEVLCADPREYSSSLTAVVVPEGFDADRETRYADDVLQALADQPRFEGATAVKLGHAKSPSHGRTKCLSCQDLRLSPGYMWMVL